MLVRGNELICKALKAGMCVPAFNVYSLETMHAALEAADSCNRGVILAVGAGDLCNASVETFAAMARQLCSEHKQDVVLHLDHCRQLETLERAAKAGFTSLMFDGSNLPLQENMRHTRRAREIADNFNCSLEGELGGLNGEEGIGAVEAAMYTDPEEARHFVRETCVDFLAVSVGNAHGLYKGKPHLEMALLSNISEAVGVPLVLHGSSGIPFVQLQQAVQHGVGKINVNTEVSLAATQCTRSILNGFPQTRLNALLLSMRDEMVRVMKGYFI